MLYLTTEAVSDTPAPVSSNSKLGLDESESSTGRLDVPTEKKVVFRKLLTIHLILELFNAF